MSDDDDNVEYLRPPINPFAAPPPGTDEEYRVHIDASLRLESLRLAVEIKKAQGKDIGIVTLAEDFRQYLSDYGKDSADD